MKEEKKGFVPRPSLTLQPKITDRLRPEVNPFGWTAIPLPWPRRDQQNVGKIKRTNSGATMIVGKTT